MEGQALRPLFSDVKPLPQKAHYNLALAHKLQGNLQEALRHYSEAARLKPDYVVAIYNMGEVSETPGQSGTEPSPPTGAPWNSIPIWSLR